MSVKNLEKLIRIGAELSKEILRLVVFVKPPKPAAGNNRHYAGNGADLLAIEAGQVEGERDAVTRDQPARGLGAALVDVEAMPQRHHEGEQQQGNANAGHRKNAATLVAEGILGDKTG